MTSKSRQSNYPIGKYLIQLWTQSGLPLAAFMKALEYRNTSKAIKRFDAWINCGIGEPHIIQSIEQWKPEIQTVLAHHLKLTHEILDIEAAEARKERIAEARRTFAPFLQAIPEHREPSSISLFALTGGNRRQIANLPEGISELNERQCFQLITVAIKSHMEKSQGQTLYQGKIILYQAFLNFDATPLTFSTDGRFVGISTDRRPGEAFLIIGKKKFPGAII